MILYYINYKVIITLIRDHMEHAEKYAERITGQEEINSGEWQRVQKGRDLAES